MRTRNGRGWRRAKGRKGGRAACEAPVAEAGRRQGWRRLGDGVAVVSKLGREVEMAAWGTVFMTSAAHKEGGECKREGGREREGKKEGKQE